MRRDEFRACYCTALPRHTVFVSRVFPGDGLENRIEARQVDPRENRQPQVRAKESLKARFCVGLPLEGLIAGQVADIQCRD